MVFILPLNYVVTCPSPVILALLPVGQIIDISNYLIAKCKFQQTDYVLVIASSRCMRCMA